MIWGSFKKIFYQDSIPSLYTEAHNNLVQDLQQVEYYALTTDLWSFTGKMEPYLAVTIHYINKDWE